MSEYVMISSQFQTYCLTAFSHFTSKWDFRFMHIACNMVILEKISDKDIVIGLDFADELMRVMVKTYEQEVNLYYNRVGIFQKSPYALVTRHYKLNNQQKNNGQHIWLHNEIKL